MVAAVAYLYAIISAFCNATFFAPNRLESVKAAQISPIIYNWYTTMGVFVFSWIIALFLPLIGLPVVTLVPAGFVAGACFTFALCFSCLALPLLGISIAMGVWCGTATLVSFLWGTIGPALIARPLQNVPLSLIGISLIICGILGIINTEALGDALFRSALFGKIFGEQLAPLKPGSSSSDTDAAAASDKALGVFYAVCVGLFGGSMLAPLAFVPEEYSGIKGIGFIPAFGTGSLLTGTLIVAALWAKTGKEPVWAFKDTLWAGLVSGSVWQFGNLCQVVAQSYYLMPYAIAYPIFQASLVFAGLLGIVAFNEIKGIAPISFFMLSAVVVVFGAGLLALYGPENE